MTAFCAHAFNSHENCKQAKPIPQVLWIVLYIVPEGITFH